MVLSGREKEGIKGRPCTEKGGRETEGDHPGKIFNGRLGWTGGVRATLRTCNRLFVFLMVEDQIRISRRRRRRRRCGEVWAPRERGGKEKRGHPSHVLPQ